jgi:predicted dinucleotide-binding enzyme
VAAHLTGARVVKAFNTIWFEHLKTQGRRDAPVDQRRAIFICADDAEAKSTVAELIADMGFGAVDLGTLRDSHKQQPDAPVYNRDVTVADAPR